MFLASGVKTLSFLPQVEPETFRLSNFWLLNQTFTVLVSYWLQAWGFQASWDEEVSYIFPGGVTLVRVEINYF